jgi:hypothetical protein
MRPYEIVSNFSEHKLAEILAQLNSGQFKSVLRDGGLSTKVPPSCVLQKARKRIWTKRIKDGLAAENEALASALLYHWLLFHRRQMLIDYLDKLGVKHVRGETEETFTKTVPQDRLLAEAKNLTAKYDAQDVAAYVLFLDYHQDSEVFTRESFISAALQKEPHADPNNQQ